MHPPQLLNKGDDNLNFIGILGDISLLTAWQVCVILMESLQLTSDKGVLRLFASTMGR